MKIVVVKQAAKERPGICPWLIDMPMDRPGKNAK